MKPILAKNDKKAKWIIWILSIVVFLVVVALDRIPPPAFPFDFDVHLLAFVNACLNSMVAACLLLGMYFAKNKNFEWHRMVMFIAIGLSVLFLVFYIGHHLFAGSTPYGGDGPMKIIYYVLLITHIILAAVILPFILFTAYRSLTGEYEKHKKIARYTWPIWLYVAISGVLVYWMIAPYY